MPRGSHSRANREGFRITQRYLPAQPLGRSTSQSANSRSHSLVARPWYMFPWDVRHGLAPNSNTAIAAMAASTIKAVERRGMGWLPSRGNVRTRSHADAAARSFYASPPRMVGQGDRPSEEETRAQREPK